MSVQGGGGGRVGDVAAFVCSSFPSVSPGCNRNVKVLFFFPLSLYLLIHLFFGVSPPPPPPPPSPPSPPSPSGSGARTQAERSRGSPRSTHRQTNEQTHKQRELKWRKAEQVKRGGVYGQRRWHVGANTLLCVLCPPLVLTQTAWQRPRHYTPPRQHLPGIYTLLFTQ